MTEQKHVNESAHLKREISRLTVLLNKTLKWFDMIDIERLCLAVSFNKKQTATLLTGNRKLRAFERIVVTLRTINWRVFPQFNSRIKSNKHED